ncbi:MAG: hypothetical protein QOG43_3242 [Actinomycetota bacterium]|jgi:hypothetical protein|nr:hypothetical protein [Actinomycetota bacterium]
MIRRTTAVTLAMVAWLAFVALPAGAQASPSASPPPVSTPVVVDLTGALTPAVDTGVLVRARTPSATPMMAVYIGLSLVAVTLALITARRRLLAVKAGELATGVVIGRRARAEFWNGGPQLHTGGRSTRPRLVGSAETVMITEHGRRVRAGYAGGGTDG